MAEKSLTGTEVGNCYHPSRGSPFGPPTTYFIVPYRVPYPDHL